MARGILGCNVEFELTLVDGFPPHPSGKFQPYVSLVERNGRTDPTAADAGPGARVV
jgi:hypothetical protein